MFMKKPKSRCVRRRHLPAPRWDLALRALHWALRVAALAAALAISRADLLAGENAAEDAAPSAVFASGPAGEPAAGTDNSPASAPEQRWNFHAQNTEI